MKSRSIQPSRDQHVREAVEQRAGRDFGLQRQVLRRGHRRLGLARIDRRRSRACAGCADALPHDRMRDAQVRADEHDARRTPRSPRRCRAARRSRTTACRRRPTWPCTAACCRRRARMPMPNLASAPSSAISSVAIWPVLRNATDCGPCLAWIALKRVDERVAAPSSQSTGRSLPPRVAQQRRRRAIGRAQRRQRLPALGAGHAEVDRVVGARASG